MKIKLLKSQNENETNLRRKEARLHVSSEQNHN